MIRFLISILLFGLLAPPFQAQSLTIPHLARKGTANQLIVQNKPFLMLAGELGNSTASDLNYMTPMWPKLKAMRLNTVLIPVYWELVEPQEGKFDFSIVDSIILSARKNDLKIVLLWFGSWKNSMSCYVPYWVKIDQERFPRARRKDGKAVEILSPFSDENRNADAKAFSSLMKHLRVIDSRQNTIVMVQVENEIGMIPEAKDYSIKAEEAFRQNVPPELMSYLKEKKESLAREVMECWNSSGMKTTGTWEEVFGKGLQTDEIFMAWYFARYTNYVAEAGKKEYPLPMFVNAALNRPNVLPGNYPSAGPLPHLIDIWNAAAPQIDFLAPDIYFKNFVEWLSKYDCKGNPVFIPEADSRQSAANAFYAMGRHNAMGYSPFSIESVENPANNQFSRGYDILQQLTPLILENQGKGTMNGFLLDSAAQTARIELGGYIFNVRHEYTWPYAARGEGEVPRFGGIIINIAENEFLIAGSGVIVTFESSSNDGTIAGIGSIDEGSFIKGKWKTGLRMNGDQSHQGRHMHLPGIQYGIQKVRLYKYK